MHNVCWSYLFGEGSIMTYKQLVILLVMAFMKNARWHMLPAAYHVTSCSVGFSSDCSVEIHFFDETYYSHLLVLWCCWFRSGLQTSSYFLVWCFSIGLAGPIIFFNWALRPVFILLSLWLYMIKVGRVEGIFSFSTEGRESRDFVEGYFAITSSHFE